MRPWLIVLISVVVLVLITEGSVWWLVAAKGRHSAVPAVSLTTAEQTALSQIASDVSPPAVTPTTSTAKTAPVDDSLAVSSSSTQSTATKATDTSSLASSLSSDATEPPLLLKSIGVELGTYDVAVNRAGDFEFTNVSLQFNRIFMGFGFHIPAEQSGNGAKDNPQPTYVLPLGTKVHSLVDGVVSNIPTVWSGDYSVMVTDGVHQNWVYETEHVQNVVVSVGDHVTAGQVVAEVSDYDTSNHPGFGIVEIGILHGGANAPEHICPFAYLDPSIKADVQAKLLQFSTDWETYKSDTSLYNESESPIGCISLEPIAG